MNKNWEMHVSTVFVFWALFFVMCTYAHFKTFYLFINAYIIPLCLFHLGIVIPNAYGMLSNFKWDKSSSFHMWLEYASWYVVLSVACIGVGVGLSMKNKKIIVVSDGIRFKITQTFNKLYLDGIGLLIASVIFLIMALISLGNLFAYSRADFFHGVGDTRGLGLFMMCLPSAAIVLMIGACSRKEKIFAATISLITFAVFLLSGYRSAALFPALVGVIIWVKVKNKIPLVVSLSAILFVLFIIPVIGMLRSVGPYNEMNTQHFKKSIQKANIENSFIELGSTIGVLAHTLRLVPAVDDYRYGITYVKSFRDSIPNIMPEMNKSYRKESSNRAMLDHKVIGKMAVPSDWITYRIAPDKYHKGEGVGFSAIGEPYLNFGIVGVVIFFLSIGYCLGRLDDSYLLDKPNLLLFLCAMFWFLIRTVRNDFSNFIKPAIFIFIIVVIWRFTACALLKNLKNNKLVKIK
ncbi:oligosaccharide repeat unit polymerase [Desulfomicrobium macestii]|uniref:Oligosaccharide repeat unit polymerase n=1 Tax=Desulfomicrobium macestii TaxID=90731 RepID=A0ABR9H9K1_9BACT|nr:oligosaccharide repeat unit polymerase [Desulfomicrobium macestii]